MNYAMVPFDFKGLRSAELVWATDLIDGLKRFRLTLKGWGGEIFGAKHPQKYMDNLRARHPELPRGLPLTVRGKTGQVYEAYTLDPIEAFPYAVESDLPGAKNYLRKYHELILALRSGAIKPCVPTHQRFYVAIEGFQAIEKAERGHKTDTMDRIGEKAVRSRATAYRWHKRYKERGTLCYDYRYKAAGE